MTIEERNQIEGLFFYEKSVDTLQREHIGIPALRKFLGKPLSNHIKRVSQSRGRDRASESPLYSDYSANLLSERSKYSSSFLPSPREPTFAEPNASIMFQQSSTFQPIRASVPIGVQSLSGPVATTPHKRPASTYEHRSSSAKRKTGGSMSLLWRCSDGALDF